MVFMKRVTILILWFLASSVYAGGETGLAVLKIGAGARASAMGEAFVALSDDASGVFWNPSGSVWINKRQAHFTYNSWIQGIHHNVAALTFPTSIGSFGIGLLLNTVDGFERRTIASEEPLGTFSAHDFSLLLNYSRQLNSSLSVGLNLKYINEKIYLDNANGYMIDLGVRYASPLSGLFLA
ncbi:MAG: PorV/PorQ family protein, partial [Calditrichaeota bacterium]